MENTIFLKWIMKSCKTILILLIMMMFIVVILNVFFRFVLNNSLGWADELARFLFVWCSLLGAVVVFNDKENIKLDIVLRMFEKKRKLFLTATFFCDLCIFIVILVFIYQGIKVFFATNNVSPALYIPMKYVYSIIPIAFILMGIVNVKFLYRDIKPLIKEIRK